MKRLITVVATLGVVLGTVGTAGAGTITFSSTGTTSGGDVSATAVFDISATGMTLTLTNTSVPLERIAQILDGIDWQFSTAPASISLLSVSAAGGVIDCTSTSCVPAAGTYTSPYGWAMVSSTPYFLAAGNGSFKPLGIVNGSIPVADKDTNGGIQNEPHNPYLLGPVTFTFGLTGLLGAPAVKDVRFYWGTAGEFTTSTEMPPPVPEVPEPTTMLLVGTGLLGAGWLRRRK